MASHRRVWSKLRYSYSIWPQGTSPSNDIAKTCRRFKETGKTSSIFVSPIFQVPDFKKDPFNLLLNVNASMYCHLRTCPAWTFQGPFANDGSTKLIWVPELASHTAAVEVATKVAADSCNHLQPSFLTKFPILRKSHLSCEIGGCYQSFLGLVAEGGTLLPRWHGFSLQDHGEGAKASVKQGPSHGRAHQSERRNCLRAMQQGMWSESTYSTAVMGGYCPPA